MNVPERMPVRLSADRIRIHWLTALCLTDALYGALTIFARSDGAAQVQLRNVLPFATPLWGAVLFASASLIWFGWSATGAACAAGAWVILTVAALFSIRSGAALSSSGWVLPAWAAGCHVLVVYEVITGLDRDRERRQRQG